MADSAKKLLLGLAHEEIEIQEKSAEQLRNYPEKSIMDALETLFKDFGYSEKKGREAFATSPLGKINHALHYYGFTQAARKLADKFKLPKILFAEDNSLMLELYLDILRLYGFSVFGVENGREALEVAFKEPFDLVLLDVSMPFINGYEVCRKLKEAEFTRDTPIVFLSAHALDVDVEIGLKAGAVEYLFKPLSPRQLMRRLEEVLRNHRLGVY